MKIGYKNLPLAFPIEEPSPSPRPLPPQLQVSPTWVDRRRPSLDGNYELGYELGKGASGSVVLAQDKKTGRYVAIKVISKQGLQDEQLVRIRREYAIMKHIEHKNWIKLLEVIENPEQICLVMEYAACGDLYTHIVSSLNGRLPEKDAREIFVQAAEGIQHLHRCGFIHRDIKPENILLGKKNHVYVADLGYGTVWEKNKLTNTPCGSLYYASPEIVKHDGVYIGPEVDVWSLGCVLYVMTTGRLPFHGSTSDSTRKLIIKGELTVPYHISPELKQLICGMLNTDPQQRSTIDYVMEHPWVTAGKKSAPKRTLARRRSFGATFATFVGGFSFGSKSKDALAEPIVEEHKAEKVKSKDKEREKEKEKEKEKTPKKEVKRRGRGRSNSDAPASIMPFDFTLPKKKEESSDKQSSGHVSPKKEKQKEKKEKKPKRRRNSFNFGKLGAIVEEGTMVELNEEGGVMNKATDSLGIITEDGEVEPGVSSSHKVHRRSPREHEETKESRKKKKSEKKMSGSWAGGDAVWGLPVICEEDSSGNGKNNKTQDGRKTTF